MQQTPAPTEAERITRILVEAEALRKQGAHREAITLLDARLPEHPRSGKLWHARMLSFRALGDAPEAIRCCEEILAMQPGNHVALKGRIDIAARFGLTDDLPRYIEAACERCPDHLPFRIRRATLLREAGEPQAALAALAPLRAEHPADAGLLIELASILRVLGRHTESLAACDAVPASAAGDGRLATLRIDALLRLGRAEEALAVADQALAARPDAATLGLRRGQVLRELGRHAEAIAWLEEVDRRHPGNAHILFQLAASHRVAGAHADSLAVLDRILAADPDHRSALLTRIEVMRLAGDGAGIADAMAQAAARLREGGDATLHATVLCKGLPHLPEEEARRVLRKNATRLAGIAATLAPELLWETYRRADQLGMGADYAGFAEALLAHDGLRFTTARAILRASLAVGLPNWQRVGARMLPHVQPADRGLFRTELATHAGMPAEALAGRERGSAYFRAEHALQISALLRQMGRVRVAARYMGFAHRRFPDNFAVLKDYVSCLAGSGQAERAQAVLAAQEARLPALPPVWREVVAQGWAEIDQPRRAMALIDGPGAHGWRDWYVANALAAAARADWPALAETFGDGTRVTPSLRGALLVESLRHADADLPAHELTITAIARIGRWMEAAPAAPPAVPLSTGPAIPRQIVQYWSQGTPPPQVQAAVASWQRAEGFTHHLFSRGEAQQFLHRELGRDWLRAFNRAGSPTEESDYFRLCRIGLQGGIYADCDDWLTGDPQALIDPAGRLTVWREPTGAVGNNLLVAPPRHPVILWAAISARNALLEGHADNVWIRTGPGLLTRAIAWRLEASAAAGTDPGLRILPRWQLGRVVQYHSPLSYKSGAGYWNRRNMAGSLAHLSRAAGKSDGGGG